MLQKWYKVEPRMLFLVCVFLWNIILQARHMMLGLQMCWITWKGKPLKPGTSIQRLPLGTKSSMIYLQPQLNNSFVKLNDTNINYNLRNIETDLALPRPYINFLKHNCKYSGAMLWNNLSYEAKTAQPLPDFKHKLVSSPSMPSTGLHWFHVIYVLF